MNATISKAGKVSKPNLDNISENDKEKSLDHLLAKDSYIAVKIILNLLKLEVLSLKRPSHVSYAVICIG